MYEKFEEVKMKMEEIKSIKCTLLSWLKDEVNSGKDCCHLQSAGDVADMIKDLSKAEKDCAETFYYMVVSQAMLEGGEPSYGSMGYNHRHTNSGRFASAGRGHMVYGFHHEPFMDQQAYIDGYLNDPQFKHKMSSSSSINAMGYTDGRTDAYNGSSKYGRSYDDYQNARRYYTASKDPAAREEMNHHAMEHVENALESMQEMWESSDDIMLKKRIMEEVSKIFNGMKAAMQK